MVVVNSLLFSNRNVGKGIFMEFAPTLLRMTESIVSGDGVSAAECFGPEGVYHDVFYGAFHKKEIPIMVADRFHRDAEGFIWDLFDPVCAGEIGYARYIFSYKSKLEGSFGKRVVFEGVSICAMRNGLISSYREVANACTGLSMMGFEPNRLSKIIGKQVNELIGRDEVQQHFMDVPDLTV
jgi:hypothetical protein